MSDIAIKVENVSKIYQISGTRKLSLKETFTYQVKSLLNRKLPFPDKEEFYALKDISFEIKKGEVMGFIGKNGAGKSTLLKILSRITPPTSGQIEIDGKVSSLLEVGTGFHPDLTGRENIYLNGTILGMSRSEIKNRFDDIVDFSGISKFIDTPVKRYSSGMYVRLAFAVAAYLEPEILIIDEVLSVGDAEFQKKCLGKIEDVSKNQGRTVLFVSHNMSAVNNLTEKCLYLHQGKALAFGETKSIVAHYLNTVAASSASYYCNENALDKYSENPIQIYSAKIDPVNESILCEIHYKVTRDISCVIAVKIRNSGETVILTSIDTDMDLGLFRKKPGLYKYTFNIPVDSLAPDSYYISLSISDMKSQRYEYLEDVLTFELAQSEVIKNSFKREGVLTIPIKWNLSSSDINK